ncbi:hypothetical protein KPE82_11955 [Acinetobacter baumannii]|uniref:ABC-three component system protein n=1 Tax=Acinetobacter baumannii TaxID=470 RepID=UPI001C0B5FE8|nr:ABC-three component system protein [Acinetobacter baumannii]MBU3096316.1 hypothetical protein [Acinetobacter baumannii]
MANRGDHSAIPAYLGYLYQNRMALHMSFSIPEDSLIYIERGDDIEFQHSNSEEFIQLKHKKPDEVLTDSTPDFWKSVIIWLKLFDKKKSSHYFLYTTSKFKDDAILKKLCNPKIEIFNDVDLKKILEIINTSTARKIIEVKDLIEKFKLDSSDLILFFNRITIIEDQERVNEIKDKIININLRPAIFEHRENVFNELEGWWLDKVIEMMMNNSCIVVKEISVKTNEILQKYFPTNLPSPHEFLEDIDYSSFLNGNYLFVKKGEAIKLKKSQLKWCILDYLKTSNDRQYWLEQTLITWDEIQKYEKRLLLELNRQKDKIYDEDDTLTEEERIEIGRKLFEWVQDFNLNIRPHSQASHICKGTYYIISDDSRRNFHWLP